MNPVFWVLAIAAVVLLWFCLSFAYQWIGSLWIKIYEDAMNEICTEDQERGLDDEE